jgi:hypothetical protein
MGARGRIRLVGLYSAFVGIILSAICTLMYSRNVDIDITSGRLRHQWRIGPVRVADRIEETRFSTFVTKLRAGKLDPRWRPVSSTSNLDLILGCHVVYFYTCVPTYLEQFMILWDLAGTDSEEAGKEARKVLQLLQEEKPDRVVQELVQQSRARLAVKRSHP